MVFQHRLGSLFDKQERVARLAGRIAVLVGADPALVERAARLCKCDLLTSMVYEFPELQGVMGRYYALHDGEPAAIADAIAQHYLPRFAGDELPAAGTAQALALADRLDSLIGIFAIGQQPSGDKDPFALRRAALGVIRLCVEKALDVDLHELLKAAAATFDNELHSDSAVESVFTYIMDRLRGYYHDQGVSIDLIDAVLATGVRRLLDIDQRIKACQAFRQLPEAESLAAANKRISNILKKTEQTIPQHVDPARLTDAAEMQLADELEKMNAAVVPLLDAGDYTSALTRLAGLRNSVDAFFDQVMVMVDDEALRANRLALLKNLSALFLRVADLSRLQS
jgi:glycyl-tRNA synthetase beta chain